MVSNKLKQPPNKPSVRSAKKEVSTEKVEVVMPGKLEKDFRCALGRHNMHLNMLEVSAQTFAHTLALQPNEAVYIRECAKKLGFHSLHPDALFASARSYLIYSHIAYVFSAGDMLCDAIRKTESMKNIKREDKDLFNALDTGDFIKKTIALTVALMTIPENRKLETINAEVTRIQGMAPFALVDYYRLIRNEELHTTGQVNVRLAANFDALPADEIKEQFGRMPNLPGSLSTDDALLCSKAWQSVAKWLCRHMLSDTDARAMIEKRFGALGITRRKKAAKRYMELELLYSKIEIDDTIGALRW